MISSIRIFLFVTSVTLLMPLLGWTGAGEDCLSSLIAFKEPTPVTIDFPGIEVASVNDPTRSTGSTLLYFPRGAHAVADERGGSVASIETSLLVEGSYSNQIDGLVFSGGSTMGLAATDGVRQVIFEERSTDANEFDFIPSIPGAVVFDYGGRIDPQNDRFVYPSREMGRQLMNELGDTFMMGRAGAGITTTVNKATSPRWGGQGISIVRRGNVKVMAVVVLNAGGDVLLADGNIADSTLGIGKSSSAEMTQEIQIPNGPRQNTTLSAIIVSIPMTRNQLRRTAVMVHTGMAAHIRPFHSPTDGDVLFAVSTGGNRDGLGQLGLEAAIAEMATQAMEEAIEGAVKSANFTAND